jgi:hypothetical protein
VLAAAAGTAPAAASLEKAVTTLHQCMPSDVVRLLTGNLMHVIAHAQGVSTSMVGLQLGHMCASDDIVGG